MQVVLSSLLSLQPSATGGGGGASKEDTVRAIATDLLEHVPPAFNLEAVMRAKADDPSALHVVLFQELERYNLLLVRVRRSCQELLKGIQGLVVMSAGAHTPTHSHQAAPLWQSMSFTCHAMAQNCSPGGPARMRSVRLSNGALLWRMFEWSGPAEVNSRASATPAPTMAADACTAGSEGGWWPGRSWPLLGAWAERGGRV